MGRLTITLPDVLLDTIDSQAAAVGKKRSVFLIQYLSDAFGLDLLTCEKCGKKFSVEADEGSFRDDGSWCNAHLHLSKGDQ